MLVSAPTDLRILHWNVHSWRDASGAQNLNSVISLAREVEPDVVSLVEVDEPWGMPSILGELADHLNYSWVLSPSFEFGTDNTSGGFGNAILTRIPILAVQHWDLLRASHPYDGTEQSEPRTVISVKLGSSSRSLWVGSTHLPRSDESARAKALHRLARHVERLDDPWIICGDFNVEARFWRDNYPSYLVNPNPERPTYPAHRPIESIDYFIGSPDIFIKAEVLPATGSDHLPVAATVSLAPA